MELNLSDKTALVTGASEGLGRACAEALAANGVSLSICARGEELLDKAAREIEEQFNVKTSPIPADLSSSADLERLVDSAISELGHVDILVLSTGHPPTFPFSAATDEQWQHGIDLLLQPVVKLSRAFLEQMKSRGFGRIIFIGSIYGIRPEVSSVIQSTLRTGLTALTKCLALEYAPFGITVNVICPGYFKTPLVDNLAKKYAEEQSRPVDDVLKDWEAFPPSKRFGSPNELGDFVAFLSSSRASLINGQSLVINA